MFTESTCEKAPEKRSLYTVAAVQTGNCDSMFNSIKGLSTEKIWSQTKWVLKMQPDRIR